MCWRILRKDEGDERILHSLGFNQGLRRTNGAMRKARRLSRVFAREAGRARCGFCAASCVFTCRMGRGCGSRLLNRGSSIPTVQFTDKEDSTVQGRLQNQEGAHGSPGDKGDAANLPSQSKAEGRHPAVCPWYCTENAVETPALRHLGTNELSGRLANFFVFIGLSICQSIKHAAFIGSDFNRSL